jgi:hypothetical protein
MTETTPPPEEHHHRAAQKDIVPEPEIMPRWVPVMIGAVLLTLGALAVATGLRYRDSGFMGLMKPRRTPRQAAVAPPGEPQPGASLMFPGDGNNVPVATASTPGRTRAEIVGGPGGVSSTVRIVARRGMIVKSVPPDAVVYVNDLAIGQAAQFDTDDEVYDFPDPGSYTIRLVAPGYKERQFVVNVSEAAPQEIALIDVKLDRER